MKLIKYFFIFLIKFYKYLISTYIPYSCRYQPTCSDYFIESLEVHGLLKGIYKGIKRIITCHPIKLLGGSEGFDPVQKLQKKDNHGH